MNGDLAERDDALEHEFPELVKAGYEIKSPCDASYNCVAFAVGDTHNWWEDTGEYQVNGYYWPPGINGDTVNGWVRVFELHGYTEADNEILEDEYEKIAIYALPDGPEHVARQKSSGEWASKMGRRYDIHHTLSSLEGEYMGKVVKIMKRRCRSGRRVLE